MEKSSAICSTDASANVTNIIQDRPALKRKNVQIIATMKESFPVIWLTIIVPVRVKMGLMENFVAVKSPVSRIVGMEEK
jgi:hypothetical protein